MPEETSNSRASPILSVRWKMLLIFGVAILLLALIVIIVSYLLTIQAIDNKLDSMVEEENKPSAGLFPVYPTSIDRQACTNYKLLTDSWRRINGLGNKGKYNCDAPSGRPGAKHIKPGDWYRFSGAAGTHLPTERLDSNAGARHVCGTDIVAWMQGSHPTVYEGPQPRDICFEWDKGPCSFTVQILVQTCYDQVRMGETFYVYQLKYPNSFSGCYWGYCALGD